VVRGDAHGYVMDADMIVSEHHVTTVFLLIAKFHYKRVLAAGKTLF
jgi:hypothetical protein